MKTLLATLSVSIALVGCCERTCRPRDAVASEVTLGERPIAVPTPTADPADAVYEAYARSLFNHEITIDANPGVRLTELVVEQTTAYVDEQARDWVELHGQLKDLRRETYDAFIRENAQRRDLHGRIRFQGQVEFLTKGQLDKQFEGDTDVGWTRFYREHPGAAGIHSMSNVGLSEDGRQALLYVAFVAGGEVKWGQCILYGLKDGSWEVVARLGWWVA